MSSTETVEKIETASKPEVGVTGRRIVYDKDGKPYVFFNRQLVITYTQKLLLTISALGVELVTHC